MKFALILALGILVFLIPSVSAVPGPCSDGTPYGQCSTVTAGYYCGISATTASGSALQEYLSHCPCSDISGWVEKGGKCVKTTCDIEGETVKNGKCSVNHKPKRCEDGNVVNNAQLCGCPEGQKMTSDGLDCIEKSGCRWGTVTCPPSQECKYDENKADDDGVCVHKKGCAYDNPKCDETETCNTATNTCEKKQGCKYNNPKCPKGKTCDREANKCVEVDEAISTAPLIAGSGASVDEYKSESPEANKAASAKTNSLCCCLPAGLGAAGVGMAFIRRKKGEI